LKKKLEEPKMIECYFISSNNKISSTICGNCGKEKMLHTIGSGIKVSTYFINPKEEPKQGKTYKNQTVIKVN
jgi:ribosomal protein L32